MPDQTPATQNLHVSKTIKLISPQTLKQEFPTTTKALKTVIQGRQVVQNMLTGLDNRLLVIAGPCSIHDEKAALEYAQKLCVLQDKLKDKLYIMMRVYFEKPRTTVGWKGLINDPNLNDTFDIDLGLKKARKLLLQINEIGLPAATELLEPITPQYIADLVSWGAIGARTTESQTHRQMASGLSMPIGYKNGTDGGLTVAINAMQSATAPHHFLGIDEKGHTAIIKTKGNPWGHTILRGGGGKPNFEPENIQDASAQLTKANLPARIMVDCSHENSFKKHDKQPAVLESVINQIKAGNTNIFGVMIESNINAGNQPIPSDLSQLKYGVSVTDACVDWETTEKILTQAAQNLS